MLAFEEALATVLAEARALAAEEVPLAESLGRTLAEDVVADLDLPPFDRVAMDGYALRAADVAGAPVALEVVGEVRAGQWPDAPVGAGQAVKAMTGAPLPPGADAVQAVERTSPLDEFRVSVLAAVPAGANVAPRGGEARRGDVVLRRGQMVDPAAVAVLASSGKAAVRVARRPLVALLVTGDEVVDVAAAPGPGQIRNSNGPAVAAQARLAGADVRLLGVAPDRQEATEAALRAGLGADVIVVSGGVSAGDYDLVEPALLALGARLLFTRVAIKPGAPLVFGRLGEALVFGLPGNPVSAQVTFELFARPALLKMQGRRVLERPRVEVELAAPVKNRTGRRSLVPARVRWEGGRLLARLVRTSGSGDLAAHARANALVVIGERREHVPAGGTAPALLLSSFLEDDGAPL